MFGYRCYLYRKLALNLRLSGETCFQQILPTFFYASKPCISQQAAYWIIIKTTVTIEIKIHYLHQTHLRWVPLKKSLCLSKMCWWSNSLTVQFLPEMQKFQLLRVLPFCQFLPVLLKLLKIFTLLTDWLMSLINPGVSPWLARPACRSKVGREGINKPREVSGEYLLSSLHLIGWNLLRGMWLVHELFAVNSRKFWYRISNVILWGAVLLSFNSRSFVL